MLCIVNELKNKQNEDISNNKKNTKKEETTTRTKKKENLYINVCINRI